MWKNDPPCLALATAGPTSIVCRPGRGHRQANSTESGSDTPALDLYFQIPVSSNVWGPSMNTWAWPSEQQFSPIVPMIATARPVKLNETGDLDRARLSRTKDAPAQNPGSVGLPCGSSTAATWA